MAIVKCPNPTCEYFQKTIPDADFCPFCGEPVNLSTMSPTPLPSPLPSPPIPFVPSSHPYSSPIQPPETPNRQVPPPTVVEKPPAHLSLIHTETKQKFIIIQIVATNNKVYLGRPEDAEKSTSVIDLSDIPYSQRISRSHAYIYWDDHRGCYVIVDNNSTNGTILNSDPLVPDQPYDLKQGDKIEFGIEQKIVFKVQIQ